MIDDDGGLVKYLMGVLMAVLSGLVLYLDAMRRERVAFAIVDLFLTLLASLVAGVAALILVDWLGLGWHLGVLAASVMGGLGVRALALYEALVLDKLSKYTGIDMKSSLQQKYGNDDEGVK